MCRGLDQGKRVDGFDQMHVESCFVRPALVLFLLPAGHRDEVGIFGGAPARGERSNPHLPRQDPGPRRALQSTVPSTRRVNGGLHRRATLTYDLVGYSVAPSGACLSSKPEWKSKRRDPGGGGGRTRQRRGCLRAVLRDRPVGAALSESIAQADLSVVDQFMDAAVAYTIVEGVLVWTLARCRDVVIRTDPRGRDDDMASLSVTGRRFTPVAGEGAPRRRRVEDGLDLVLARQAVEAAGLTMKLHQGGDALCRPARRRSRVNHRASRARTWSRIWLRRCCSSSRKRLDVRESIRDAACF